MTARVELARLIAEHEGIESHLANIMDEPTAGAIALADAILAAGFTRPRIVSTVEELEALGDGAVVRVADDKFGNEGAVLMKTQGHMYAADEWYAIGSDEQYESRRINLPARILFEPSEKETKTDE